MTTKQALTDAAEPSDVFADIFDLIDSFEANLLDGDTRRALADKIKVKLAILALHRPEQAEKGWQPIETAPKDGTAVMLWEQYSTSPVVGVYSVQRGKWYADTEHYDTNGDAIVIDRLSQELITHWMPLPPAPAIDSTKGLRKEQG